MDTPRSPRINNQPLYLQTIDAIKALIEGKAFEPGAMLPPEETLARQLGISRLTLREALGYLENDGFVERRRGVGTFVTEPSHAHFCGGLERLEPLRVLAHSAGRDVRSVARQVEILPAEAEWAIRLEVPPGTDLVRVRVTQAIDRVITAHFDSLAPVETIDLAELRACDGSLLEYMLERGKPVLTHTRSAIDAVNADQTVAGILGVAEGTAVLRLSETFYLSNRRPVSVSDNYFLTDSFNFYISRRAARRLAR
jgi:GntR family transcriptional regulator